MKNVCCFTGHRPNKLYGYDLNHKGYQILAKNIRACAKNLVLNYGVDTFISGGALGVDTVAFFAIESLKKEFPNVKNVIAVPFDGQSRIWKSQVDIDRYNRMLKIADKLIYVDKLQKYSANSIGAKLNRRNDFMVDSSSYIITAWNGDKSGGTFNCLKAAHKRGLTMFNVFSK